MKWDSSCFSYLSRCECNTQRYENARIFELFTPRKTSVWHRRKFSSVILFPFYGIIAISFVVRCFSTILSHIFILSVFRIWLKKKRKKIDIARQAQMSNSHREKFFKTTVIFWMFLQIHLRTLHNFLRQLHLFISVSHSIIGKKLQLTEFLATDASSFLCIFVKSVLLHWNFDILSDK